MKVCHYDKSFRNQIIDLITGIQQREFNIPVTMGDQPDLLDIENTYCTNNGNFWIALDTEQVIGTIALIDIGNKQSCLRKMFVRRDYRGKEKGTAQLLMDTCIQWCKQKDIQKIYLGTIDKLEAAQRFYLKNHFVEIPKEALPEHFPVMQVDNRFFKRTIFQKLTQ